MFYNFEPTKNIGKSMLYSGEFLFYSRNKIKNISKSTFYIKIVRDGEYFYSKKDKKICIYREREKKDDMKYVY